MNVLPPCWVAVFSLVASVAIAAEPQAKAPSARLPAVVAKALRDHAAICSEVGGKPLMASAVKTIDLNGDGFADYVLFDGNINCDGAPGVFGDREKAVVVFSGDAKGGATESFSDFVFGAMIEGRGAAAKLWLGVSGEACGKRPGRDFANESFCDRPIVWTARTGKFVYAPVSQARMIQ